jgi:hypothetical protein
MVTITKIKEATQATSPVADSAALPADISTTDRYVEVGQIRQAQVRVETSSGAQSGARASKLHLVLDNATAINYTLLGPPEAGDELTVFINTTAAHTLLLDGSVTFDGTNQTNTFAAKGDTLHMIARTVGLWDIITNDGTLSA